MFSTPHTLLEQLRQPHEPQAWDRFVALYTPLLLIWARRQGLQDADAADLTQDVLVKLVGLLPAYDRTRVKSFRGWLFTICTNQCRDFRRRVATRPLPNPDGLSKVDDDAPVAELEEAEYRQELVRRGLELIRENFDPKTWAAFTGFVLEERPAAEVAKQLGLSAGAVYQARHRVLARLRLELEGFLD